MLTSIMKEAQKKNSGHNLQALAKEILVALNDAFKKILLYPPGHIIYQTSLESLKNVLDNFLDRHGNLVLKIDRNKIFYNGKMVYEGPMKGENPAFILFRDGIYHLEFHKSIEQWEIQSFLEILQKYQNLTENTEDNVVTALWKLELPSLRYRAYDIDLDAYGDFEIPELESFEASEDQYFEISESGDSETSKNDLDPLMTNADNAELTPSLHIPIDDLNLWKITPEDQAQLRDMLVEEENWEHIEYFLYALRYIFQTQTQPDDFSEVITFLNQELQDAMKDQKYRSVYNILQALRENLDSNKTINLWTIPLLEDFFASLSGKEFLNIIHDDLYLIDRGDPQELDYLKRALLMLNANAINTLVPILLETKPNQTRGMLVGVISILAEREFEHLENLLSSLNTDMVIMLAHVMGFMKSEQSLKRLLELLRHTSESVRKGALKAIFRRNSNIIINELFWLMDDPNEGIKELFLQYAAQQRNVKTERLLLDYLKKHRIRWGKKQFFFRVYISLGKCGSDESIPFLKKDLFLLPELGILRPKKSLRRQAAVYALKGLRTAKADSMLERESKRLLPVS